jgi:hypothetical protein
MDHARRDISRQRAVCADDHLVSDPNVRKNDLLRTDDQPIAKVDPTDSCVTERSLGARVGSRIRIREAIVALSPIVISQQ